MDIEYQRIDDETINVSSPSCRGFDWQLIRQSGGTYAHIAGKTDEDGDEEIVIEEYDAPDQRASMDSKSDEQIIEMVFREIGEL